MDGKEKLKVNLGVNDERFNEVKRQFKNAEEKDILTGVIIGIINGKTLKNAIYDISYKNEYLNARNTKKLYDILENNQVLVLEVIKEILHKNYTVNGFIN